MSMDAVLEQLQGVDLAQLPAPALSLVNQYLATRRIEAHEILSRRPGEYENPGAHPKQLEFQRAFFAQKHRIYAASGSNQSGKTTAVGGLCFCKWLRDGARNGDVYWIIGLTQDLGRDVPSKTLWDYLPRFMFPANLEYQPRYGFGLIPTLELNLPDGRGKCEVWFKSEVQDKQTITESARLNGIWWTECADVQIFDCIFPRLAVRHGWMLMDYVPLYGWHRSKIRVPAETGDPDVYHVRFCTRDNAHNMPAGEIEFLRRRMPERIAKVRIDGEDGALEDAAIPEFDPSKHVIQPCDIPAQFPRWRCFDYGHTNPSALLWCVMVPPDFDLPGVGRSFQERGVVYQEFYQSGCTVQQIADAVRSMSFTLDGGDATYRGGVISDPTIFNVHDGDGNTIGHKLCQAGLPCVPGVRTNRVGEHAMVAEVRMWFEADKLFFFNRCRNAIREHQDWKMKRSRDGYVRETEPFEDKDNHTCDALKLWIAERPRYAGVKVEVRDWNERNPWTFARRKVG